MVADPLPGRGSLMHLKHIVVYFFFIHNGKYVRPLLLMVTMSIIMLSLEITHLDVVGTLVCWVAIHELEIWDVRMTPVFPLPMNFYVLLYEPYNRLMPTS